MKEVPGWGPSWISTLVPRIMNMVRSFKRFKWNSLNVIILFINVFVPCPLFVSYDTARSFLFNALQKWITSFSHWSRSLVSSFSTTNTNRSFNLLFPIVDLKYDFTRFIYEKKRSFEAVVTSKVQAMSITHNRSAKAFRRFSSSALSSVTPNKHFSPNND